MTHAPTTRRTTHSRASVPLRDPRRRDLILAGGVGGVMLIIIALYAASFPKNEIFNGERDDLPRWGVVTRELFEAVEPSLSGLNETRSALAAVLSAKMTQAESIELMKKKIESASATPEPTPQN